MVQGKRIKNIAWTRSDEQAKDIMREIMKNVHRIIDARNMIKSIVSEIVEKAMTTSNGIRCRSTTSSQACSVAALKAVAAARFDLLIIKYRREPKLVVTNLINGQEYTVSLKPEDLYKLREVGYKTRTIVLGTTKHLYGALRAVMVDLKRSTSLRIWYLDDNKRCIVVQSDDWTPITRIIDRKLFVTKLWDTVDKRTSEDEDDSEADQASMTREMPDLD